MLAHLGALGRHLGANMSQHGPFLQARRYLRLSRRCPLENKPQKRIQTCKIVAMADSASESCLHTVGLLVERPDTTGGMVLVERAQRNCIYIYISHLSAEQNTLKYDITQAVPDDPKMASELVGPQNDP